VQVKVYNTSWLSETSDQIKFMKLLATHEDQQIFGDDFVKSFLEYQNLKNEIIVRGLLPYIAHLILTVSYMIWGIPLVQQKTGAAFVYAFTFWWVGIVLTMIPTWLFRVRDMKYHSEHSSYGFEYHHDYNSYAQLLLLATIFFLNLFGFKGTLIPILASLVCFLLTIKGIYWIQLFKSLAMYWRIVVNSIVDSRDFFTLCFIIMFAFALSILSMDNTLQGLADQGLPPGDDF